MNDMQNMTRQLAEKERQHDVYERAMASLNLQRQMRAGEGEAIMLAWSTFAEESQPGKMLGAASKAAAMFCIGFAFLVPSLMLIRFVL